MERGVVHHQGDMEVFEGYATGRKRPKNCLDIGTQSVVY